MLTSLCDGALQSLLVMLFYLCAILQHYSMCSEPPSLMLRSEAVWAVLLAMCTLFIPEISNTKQQPL